MSPDHPEAARYAVGVWRPPASRVRRLVVQAAMTAGVPLPGREVLTVATAPGHAPGWAALAERAGADVGTSRSWFLATPGTEARSRVAAFLFGAAAAPVAVVKVIRVPNVTEPFDRDEAGLALAHAVGPSVSAHVPRLLTRGTVDGHSASVESVAAGRPLSKLLLDSDIPESDRLRIVDDVAQWIIELGRIGGTARAAAANTTRVDELRGVLVPEWPEVAPAVLDRLPSLPAIVAHGDLGTWNVMSDGTTFVALDWEAARPNGLPLFDLAYFLADALSLASGARTVDERVDAMVELFAGRTAQSPRLFGWFERAAGAAGLPRDVVAPLVVLSWLTTPCSPRPGTPPEGGGSGRRNSWRSAGWTIPTSAPPGTCGEDPPRPPTAPGAGGWAP